jgi:hypothetical protein
MVVRTSEEHTHTDECWEPNSGCDMGRNEKFVALSPGTKAMPTSKDEPLRSLKFAMGAGMRKITFEDSGDIVRVVIQMLDEPHEWYYLDPREVTQLYAFLGECLGNKPTESETGVDLDKWKELARHLRYCVECSDTDVQACSEGRPLWDACWEPALKANSCICPVKSGDLCPVHHSSGK